MNEWNFIAEPKDFVFLSSQEIIIKNKEKLYIIYISSRLNVSCILQVQNECNDNACGLRPVLIGNLKKGLYYYYGFPYVFSFLKKKN